MATKDKLAYSKKWRKGQKENHRLEIFAMEYLRCKYLSIHTEIQEKFKQINAKYPNKHNLTKTPEFTVWKTDLMPRHQPVPVVNTSVPTAQEPVSRLRPAPAVSDPVATVQEPVPQQEPATATVTTTTNQDSTTTTVVTTSQELSTLYSMNKDPWLNDLDSSEMTRIINELSNDPELQGIMDTFYT